MIFYSISDIEGLFEQLSDLEKKTSFTGGLKWLTPCGLSVRNLLEILTLLLEAGASHGIQNRFGISSLHLLFESAGIAWSNLEVSIREFLLRLLRRDVDVLHCIVLSSLLGEVSHDDDVSACLVVRDLC